MKTILPYFCLILFALVTISACQTSQPQQENKEQTKPATTTTSSTPTNPRTDSLIMVFNEGQALFNQNCLQCHTTNKERMIGPGLLGVLERREVGWVTAFIKNSQKLIASGDSIAVALYNEYNKTQMQSFALNQEQMQSLLFYLANLGRKQSEYITLDELPKIKKK
ncbi:MAG TPA: hypothetical protein DCS93_34580 [Microscillaceae bacterium]|nr:hypothetical protein [Microscillaceae bacterium]